MIDWDLTLEKYGYGMEILNSWRPSVICRCDKCNKSKSIKIRHKAKLADNQIDWICPSCVKKRDSQAISAQMAKLWEDSVYRSHQLKIKASQDYKNKQSELAKTRWSEDQYRSRIEKDIAPTDYINRFINLHGDTFDFSKSNFKKWHDKILVICQKCGAESIKDPQKHLAFGYCPSCGQSKGQREIAEYVHDLGHTPLINDRTQLKDLELDIYLPISKLAIEYHGLYWHSYNQKESKDDINRHQDKAIMCSNSGIRLLQFYDFEWLHKPFIVKSMISNALGMSQKLNARQMSISIIDNKTSKEFFDENHLYGHRSAKITVALMLDNKIQAAMSFSKMGSDYEIIRLAYLNNTTIRGGASKLLAYATKNISPRIVTFADLRYSTGNVYSQLGFKKVKITCPGYFYYKQSGTNYNILSRHQCQKHKLHKLLPNYDSNHSESLNMFNHGYRRVWNAGHILYSLNS